MNICEIVNDYNLLYKKRSYGIDIEDCEVIEKLKLLEYNRDKLSSTCTTKDCISCGTTKEAGSYTCAFITIEAYGPNGLMATLDSFTYCYNEATDVFRLSFVITVSYNNPSTITYTPISASLDGIPVTPAAVSLDLVSISPKKSRLNFEVPNIGTVLATSIRVSDGTTNINIPYSAILSIEDYLCS